MVMNPGDEKDKGITTSSESAAITQELEDDEEEELAECDCCGLTEECTHTYIAMIRQRYQGKWICGLCAEAVHYEMRFLNTEEALMQHMTFCNQFKSSVSPPNPAVHLISAMTHILRRSMSPTKPATSEISDPALSEMRNTSRAEF